MARKEDKTLRDILLEAMIETRDKEAKEDNYSDSQMAVISTIVIHNAITLFLAQAKKKPDTSLVNTFVVVFGVLVLGLSVDDSEILAGRVMKEHGKAILEATQEEPLHVTSVIARLSFEHVKETSDDEATY